MLSPVQRQITPQPKWYSTETPNRSGKLNTPETAGKESTSGAAANSNNKKLSIKDALEQSGNSTLSRQEEVSYKAALQEVALKKAELLKAAVASSNPLNSDRTSADNSNGEANRLNDPNKSSMLSSRAAAVNQPNPAPGQLLDILK